MAALACAALRGRRDGADVASMVGNEAGSRDTVRVPSVPLTALAEAGFTFDPRYHPSVATDLFADWAALKEATEGDEAVAAGPELDAVGAVIKEGKVRSYDMMKLPGGAGAIGKGAATTAQMTDAILAKLG